ncbi:dynein light chain 2, cytoplasmic isoform 2-T8 [Amazona ochrocephala]
MSDRKAVIKNADMSEDMQQDAVDCATQAMEKYNIEKDIAAYIKKGSRLPLQDSPSDFLPALSRKFPPGAGVLHDALSIYCFRAGEAHSITRMAAQFQWGHEGVWKHLDGSPKHAEAEPAAGEPGTQWMDPSLRAFVGDLR